MVKRKGGGKDIPSIKEIGWNGPNGIEYEPEKWPLEFIERAIVILKAARPTR